MLSEFGKCRARNKIADETKKSRSRIHKKTNPGREILVESQYNPKYSISESDTVSVP